jgi:hypothetical protein
LITENLNNLSPSLVLEITNESFSLFKALENLTLWYPLSLAPILYGS